jgi:phage tail sheath protein FI
VPDYLAPGVYIEEIPSANHTLTGVGTSTFGAVGVTPDASALINDPTACDSWSEFHEKFCQGAKKTTALAQAVRGFFANGGSRCYVVNVGTGGSIAGGASGEEGLGALKTIDDVAIVAAPGETSVAVQNAVITHCEEMGDRFAILDSPAEVKRLESLTIVAESKASGASDAGEGGGKSKPGAPPIEGARSRATDRAAYYFPWYWAVDALNPDQEVLTPPSGAMAGIYARTDARRGVHKAPANEIVRDALRLSRRITQEQHKSLNGASVNVIRWFSDRGAVVFGARTLATAKEWQYVPVRRFALMFQETIMKGNSWVVFEPNNLALWMKLKMNIEEWCGRLWREGALAGATPREAFFVKCDREVNTPDVVDSGQVIVVIGLAIVRPAEFVVFRISQFRGGSASTEETT